MNGPQAELDLDAVRSGTWACLAALTVAPPTASLLGRLRATAVDHGMPRPNDALAQAWSALAEAADHIDREALNDEYHAVFVGVGGGEVTPYASWYRNKSLFDRALLSFRADLAVLGIEHAEDVSEPEDHVAVMCEVMALVVGDASLRAAWEQALFERHLAPWLPAFFADLQHAPSAIFYRAVGQLGHAFLTLEERFFAMNMTNRA